MVKINEILNLSQNYQRRNFTDKNDSIIIYRFIRNITSYKRLNDNPIVGLNLLFLQTENQLIL